MTTTPLVCLLFTTLPMMIRVQHQQHIDHVLMVVSLWTWASSMNMWQFQGGNETTTNFDAQQIHHSFQQQQTGDQCLQCGYLPKVLHFETLVIFHFYQFEDIDQPWHHVGQAACSIWQHEIEAVASRSPDIRGCTASFVPPREFDCIPIDTHKWAEWAISQASRYQH